ncbi:exosortase A [Altererythrobacter salegens]|uniref:Exosortase A n=1 Tax=Croceibacterium salegens TaxID=1737568 RepID=A0A6I4SUF1_9SPHN|nr:exosortase A [Croceibacterium salegens]MXO59531.1 exosortase A [Croceibacterium salegens]
MPRELALPRLTALHPASLPQAWRRPLTWLALAWLALFALASADWAAMAHQWWDVSTYNHVLLVPPIIGWLVYLRRPLLAGLAPAAWWPGLLPVSGALFLWLLGSVSGLNSASQFGAVLALQAALLTLLGPRVAAALLFPLAYMLFLVPFGDELVPALQLVTAKLTIALTHLSGVPARIEGVFIDTPVGLFEVAEACSGVKFLIAMVALGTLVAHACFRSWKRRALFMAAAVVVPILANGVRAWGTIYIAQSQGLEFAAGFDHIFYGWIFFALVMTVLFAASWRFFDRAPDDTAPDPAAIANSPLLARLDGFRIDGRAALLAIGGMVLAVSLWSATTRSLEAPLPAAISLPQVPGWERVDYAPHEWWEPRAAGADHRLLGRYRDAAGHEVDIFYALYARQDEGREAGAYGEGALMPETAWRWLEPAAAIAGGQGEWLQARGKVRRLAMTWYHSGALTTGDRSRLKLSTMGDKLAMRAQPVSTLILSAEAGPKSDPQAAIRAFLSAAGQPGAWMDGIAQVP